MNTPNPLMPQGSLQGQAKGKSNFRIAVFTILAIHVVLICGFLIFGCKPDPNKNEGQPVEDTSAAPTNDLPPIDTTINDTAVNPNPFPTDTNAQPDYSQPGGNVGLGNTGAVSAVNTTTAGVVTPGVPGTTPGTAGVTAANSFTSAPAIPDTGTSAVSPFTGGIEQAPVAIPGATATHKIAKGETLSTIARNYKVSVRAIEEVNPGLNPLRLQIGQSINIPAGAAAPTVSSTSSTVDVSSGDFAIYTVKPGDVLERIAKRNNTTVRAIKEANGLKLDRINVGQKLKIPKSAQ